MVTANREQKSPAKRFLFILGLVMFALYFLLGLYIIFSDSLPLAMDKPYRIAFGALLIVYAFFRFVRVLKARKE